MPRIKVKPKARKVRAGRVKLDSLKTKLGARVYVGDMTDRVQRERDSLELEVKKLKMEIKKK